MLLMGILDRADFSQIQSATANVEVLATVTWNEYEMVDAMHSQLAWL